MDNNRTLNIYLALVTDGWFGTWKLLRKIEGEWFNYPSGLSLVSGEEIEKLIPLPDEDRVIEGDKIFLEELVPERGGKPVKDTDSQKLHPQK